MLHQHVKMIAFQLKLIASIPAMVIKTVSANAHVIMRRVPMHVHAILDAIMAVHVHMKASIVALVRRALKKNISYAKT